MQRVRALRNVLGFKTSNSFADYLGVSYQRWNNVERGLPLSRDMAFLLVDKCPGLTLDYLYFGRKAGMSFELANKLEKAEQNGNGLS